MSKLIEKLKHAELERQAKAGIGPGDSTEEIRSRIEYEKTVEEGAQARAGEERRGLDLARERQAAEVELRRLAHSRIRSAGVLLRILRASAKPLEGAAPPIPRANGEF